jgi:hypothetical protein
LDGGDRPEDEALAEAHESVSDDSTDGAGRARLRSLRQDTFYRLEVSAREKDEAIPYKVDHWTPADTVARLERGYVVEGVVRDRDGKPVEDAKVGLWKGEQREAESTDEEGRFRFDELPEGTFPMDAARSYKELGGEPGPNARTVAAGTRDVAFTLDPGVPLVLRGHGSRKATFWRVLVYVRETGRLREVRDQSVLSEDDPLTLRGFEPGRPYVVWVPPNAQDPRYAIVEVADVAAGPVELSLQKGATLRLRREGSNDPVPRGYLQATSDVGLHFYGSNLLKDGALSGVPPGTWTLSLDLGDDGDWTATVKVGIADTDVVLRPE